MSKPLIIQSDKTLLLEVDNPEFEECRAIISRFAELEKVQNTYIPIGFPLFLYGMRRRLLCQQI